MKGKYEQAMINRADIYNANLGEDEEVTYFPRPKPAKIVEPEPAKVAPVPVKEPVKVG